MAGTRPISQTKAIFLDLVIFKGKRWQSTGHLDTKCYQKPMNRYLYTPESSEHPKHCFRGIVHGELRRYIKRCSSRDDYLMIAIALRHRLSLRGFAEKSLATAFKTAPRYESRQLALTARQTEQPGTSPVIVFSTTYSSSLQNSSLSRAIFLHRDYLPKHFDDIEMLTAWKVSKKIGGHLICFKFPKPELRRRALIQPVSEHSFTEIQEISEAELNLDFLSQPTGNSSSRPAPAAAEPAIATSTTPVTLMSSMGERNHDQ
eukprot:SAG31_NODE_2491_length_5612_cov_23.752766_5_plen_260_part_00